MAKKAIFAGLVIDEEDNVVETTYVGSDSCYVVNDGGFLRHVPSEHVDRQVLKSMADAIQGNEDLLSEQAAKMLGQDDIFTRAMIETQLKQMEDQFDRIMDVGIPENSIAYMGMTGFRIRINLHGEVIEIDQPGMTAPDDE